MARNPSPVTAAGGSTSFRSGPGPRPVSLHKSDRINKIRLQQTSVEITWMIATNNWTSPRQSSDLIIVMVGIHDKIIP